MLGLLRVQRSQLVFDGFAAVCERRRTRRTTECFDDAHYTAPSSVPEMA
jgi:hypothetical protein